jgi:hypothetical protein
MIEVVGVVFVVLFVGLVVWLIRSLELLVSKDTPDARLDED